MRCYSCDYDTSGESIYYDSITHKPIGKRLFIDYKTGKEYCSECIEHINNSIKHFPRRNKFTYEDTSPVSMWTKQ